MLKIFTEVIQYESSKIINYKFSDEKMVDSTLINEARNLDIKQFFQTTINEDEEEGDFIYNYRHRDGRVSIINGSKRHCTCTKWFDKGICSHLVRVALLNKLALPGLLVFNLIYLLVIF